jgi:hypothetical protein
MTAATVAPLRIVASDVRGKPFEQLLGLLLVEFPREQRSRAEQGVDRRKAEFPHGSLLLRRAGEATPRIPCCYGLTTAIRS